MIHIIKALWNILSSLLEEDTMREKDGFFFYEVGARTKESGKSDNNKLYKKSKGFYQGSPEYSTERKYVLTQIRKNKTI